MSEIRLGQNIQQRQAQSFVLTPQLRQSLNILQAATLDLRSVIQGELQSNPTLEELPGSEPGPEENSPDSGSDPDSDNDDFSEAPASDPSAEMLGKLGDDWRDQLAEDGEADMARNSGSDEHRQYLFDSLAAESSLQEDLLRQAALVNASPAVRSALNNLIGNLDERGFIIDPIDEIATASGQPTTVIQRAWDILKTFEPDGIGARDLAECLLIQLRARGREDSLAAQIIADHFDLLTRRRIPEIAAKMGVSLKAAQSAIDEIRLLNPSPARHYAEDKNRVVVPDVTVEKEGDDWVVKLNSDYIPRLRISSHYREMIARGTLTQQERDYLRERIRSGKFLISSIDQRQRTIERIVRELLKQQRDFFEEGLSKLRPLTMTQLADTLGVHETTIGRAVANKFIQTPHGVFALKDFFTAGYATTDGSSVSSTSVKEKVAALIAAEDRTRPLSDQDIVQRLSDEGIHIARRTAAKYREALGILPGNLRREYS